MSTTDELESMSTTELMIECVLINYEILGITGSKLREKMIRAANKYEKTGELPKNLVYINDPRLLEKGACHKFHIIGVTFFNTTKEAKKSPLYINAEILGKKVTPIQFLESARRKGQTSEGWKERVNQLRLIRNPSKQLKERTKLESQQDKSLERLQKLYYKKLQETKLKQQRQYADLPELIPLEQQSI